MESQSPERPTIESEQLKTEPINEFDNEVQDLAKKDPESPIERADLSKFEHALFRLFRRLVTALKQDLTQAQIPKTSMLRQFAHEFEATYEDIYDTRIEELASLAGFSGNRGMAKLNLQAALNPGVKMPGLLRQIESELMAIDESPLIRREPSDVHTAGTSDGNGQQWAVCPRLPLQDLAVINEPLLFDTKFRAQVWLNEASIFVHEWSNAETTDREEWLRKIARKWNGFGYDESLLTFVETGTSLTPQLPRLKRVPEMPTEIGNDVYVCSLEKWARTSCGDVIAVPIPVHKLSDDAGPPYPGALKSMLDPDQLDIEPADWDELFAVCRVTDVESWMWCLADDWDFAEIERQTFTHSKWHNFEGLDLDNLRRLFARQLHGLETQLKRRHPHLSAPALRAFWMSWQFKRHLYDMARRIDEYISDRPRLKKRLDESAQEARSALESKLGYLCTTMIDKAALGITAEPSKAQHGTLSTSSSDVSEPESADSMEARGIDLPTAALSETSDDNHIAGPPSPAVKSRALDTDAPPTCIEPEIGFSTTASLIPTWVRRHPDVDTSRKRIELLNTLSRELAIIKQETRRYCTVETLKRKYPEFALWNVIKDSQIKELVDGEDFKPRAYAANLTLVQFGLTSLETLKKDRRKLRKSERDH